MQDQNNTEQTVNPHASWNKPLEGKYGITNTSSATTCGEWGKKKIMKLRCLNISWYQFPYTQLMGAVQVWILFQGKFMAVCFQHGQASLSFWGVEEASCQQPRWLGDTFGETAEQLSAQIPSFANRIRGRYIPCIPGKANPDVFSPWWKVKSPSTWNSPCRPAGSGTALWAAHQCHNNLQTPGNSTVQMEQLQVWNAAIPTTPSSTQ